MKNRPNQVMAYFVLSGTLILSSFYGCAFVFGSVFYLIMKDRPVKTAELASLPSVGIIYLCCDDPDIEALESLANLRYDGTAHLGPLWGPSRGVASGDTLNVTITLTAAAA